MLLVIPATSAIRPTSYLASQPYEPQSYDYYPSQGFYPLHDTPRFSAHSYPSYPSHRDFFARPSAEELEEREYRQALEVVVNHRRRQAEKEVAIHRQQLAEAARQRYSDALAAELEQRREAHLLAARCAGSIRSQQARARLAAAERQHALSGFQQQLRGHQPVCDFFVGVTYLNLIRIFPQVTCRPQGLKRKPFADVLKQYLTSESDADVTEPIKNILSSLEPRPVEPEARKAPSEDAPQSIENLLSSIFPGLALRTQPEPTPSTEQVQPSVPDKGKGKARAADVEEPKKPETEPESIEDVFADVLKHFMGLSKSTPPPRSADEAGPSGSSSSSPTKPVVANRERVQIDRAIALSSVEHIQNTLTKLQTEFVLPTELDHYATPIDERDETASVSSVSSSDLTKLIPYTYTNKPVYTYENELQGLLEELDRIDSHGDAEVREKRKAVVKAVEKVLEGVENIVGETVGKRLSLISTATAAPEESLKGFDVDGDTTGEAVPTQEQVDTPLVVDSDAVPEPSATVLEKETVISSAGVPANESVTETETPTIPNTPADPPVEQTSPEFDVEPSTATITPESVNPRVETEAEPTVPHDQSHGAPEITATLLLSEKVSPPSPAGRKAEQVSSGAEDEVVSVDSDAERSDWSEVEH